MSTQEQRERFEAWKRTIPPVHREEIACMWAAWKAAEAAAIERCAKFMEARADEIAAAENCTANMMAMIYRDEAKSLRALLPKEE